jgi:hypothetical protein
MLATLTLYLYIGVVVNPHVLNLPVWDHAWRLSFMLAVVALATGAALVLGAGIRALGGGPGASPDTKPEPPTRSQRPTDTDGFLRRTILAVRVGPEPLPRSITALGSPGRSRWLNARSLESWLTARWSRRVRCRQNGGAIGAARAHRDSLG